MKRGVISNILIEGLLGDKSEYLIVLIIDAFFIIVCMDRIKDSHFSINYFQIFAPKEKVNQEKKLEVSFPCLLQAAEQIINVSFPNGFRSDLHVLKIRKRLLVGQYLKTRESVSPLPKKVKSNSPLNDKSWNETICYPA